MMAMTGRPVALGELDGPGVRMLATRPDGVTRAGPRRKLSEGSPRFPGMDDNRYLPRRRRLHTSASTAIVTVGDTEYLVTAFPQRRPAHRPGMVEQRPRGPGGQRDQRRDLAGRPARGLTDVLTSTLAGLVALTQHARSRAAPPPDRRGRHPNQGARWTAEDDARLIERYRAGAAHAI